MNDSKILIIGAGMAGLTLAALVRQRGVTPVIIEKQTESSFEEAGYMLGLLPLGGRVLNALGKQNDYLDRSCATKEYIIFDGRGRKLNSYPLTRINEHFGPYRGISRRALLGILREAASDQLIRFDTTVDEIVQGERSAIVTFDDGQTEQFDVIVIADGLHSQTRQQILSDDEFAYKSTGWGGWVSWIDEIPAAAHSYREYWGAGYFLGLYPVKGKIGTFLGGPVRKLQQTGRAAFAAEVNENVQNNTLSVQKALESFNCLDNPYFWDFHDCKTKRWRKGRLILLGDAATGFLPTAGIGASMAMDSAAALDDELSRADLNHLEYALKLYENRQRAKVEKAQKKSRDLGKWGFVDSVPKAWVRDKLVQFYGLKKILGGFEDIMMGN